MPQLIFLGLIAAVGYFGYRAFLKEAERVSARVRQAEEETRTGANGTLVYDPETGEYRPAPKDD